MASSSGRTTQAHPRPHSRSQGTGHDHTCGPRQGDRRSQSRRRHGIAATHVISISGASRELTEGLGSRLAAVVLLSVGIWMHRKSQVDQWQHYIREKAGWRDGSRIQLVPVRPRLCRRLSRGFRNHPLFCRSVGARRRGHDDRRCWPLAAIAAIAWLMLRYSRTLPVGTFFRYSSWLMAVLTVVLAGKGISALQEAGWVDVAPLHDVPRLSMLGLFPTVQSLTTQVATGLAVVVGLAVSGRKHNAAARPRSS